MGLQGYRPQHGSYLAPDGEFGDPGQFATRFEYDHKFNFVRKMVRPRRAASERTDSHTREFIISPLPDARRQ